MGDTETMLEHERFENAMLFATLYDLVDAIENNSGYEPSKSVYDRSLDIAKEVLGYDEIRRQSKEGTGQ